MRTMLPAVAILMLALPASAARLETPLSGCAVKEAARLEPSGEPADVVALAAVASEICAEFAFNPFGLVGANLYEKHRQWAIDSATSAVVQIRLSRIRAPQ
jgi:hypothetical protein